MTVTSVQAHRIFDFLLTSLSGRYRAKLANDLGECSLLRISYTGFCAITRKKFDSPHLCLDCTELLTSINHDPGKSGFAEKSSRTLVRAMGPYLASVI